jgi:hypothetical protein
MIDIVAAFSRYRLAGEPIPPDVEILLRQRDELLCWTGFELNWQTDWAPWLATNYLTNEDQADPEIMAGFARSPKSAIGLRLLLRMTVIITSVTGAAQSTSQST